MTTTSVATTVLQSSRFKETVAAIATRSVLVDFPQLFKTVELAPLDWSAALTMASVLTSDDEVEAQDGVLRIAQGCLISSETSDGHRRAASLLLERVGNLPAIRLAESRDRLPPEAWTLTPAPLQLDVVRRRLELTVPLGDGSFFVGNPFQREFWSAANWASRLSVSAPTSAGKSYVVRRWFEELAISGRIFRGAYLVPTRALIDEVSAELRRQFAETDVRVFTIPWEQDIGEGSREILVMTQERLHLVMHRFDHYVLDLLFVDEAQKFGDGERGVLLQEVLDESERRSSEMQVIFASPLSSNPEILVRTSEEANRSVIDSQTITVNQNLLWADQVPGKPTEWELRLVAHGQPAEVGVFSLPARPQPPSKRLPLVAVALGGSGQGNVVYANGPADAEKIALQISDALSEAGDLVTDARIADVRELVQKTIHPDYALADVLRSGVGFHYGNMPLLVRAEIERLFRDGQLRYLVCTSTLLEGVNLPCRNLFARAPTKGRGKPMSSADFWNLAGRAGRWGKEFQGNIVCVDAGRPGVWANPPLRRERQPLVRATDHALADPDALLRYISSGAPVDTCRENPLLESLFSYLANAVAQGRSLATLDSVPRDRAAELEAVIKGAWDRVEIHQNLVARHAGIGPLAVQRLLERLRESAVPAPSLVPPESDNAAGTYADALGLCNLTLGSDFGGDGRRFMLALLITQWMRGRPLAYMISNRLSYLQKTGRPFKLPTVIREVMSDIEQVARFEAPKYLACYRDVLAVHLTEVGKTADAARLPDVAMMLELGVSRDTEVSLMSLGLSRTTAVELSEYITADSLTPGQALEWLRENVGVYQALPALVRREIDDVLAAKRDVG